MAHHHSHQADETPPDEIAFTQEYWDDRYASSEKIWSGQPNPRLVEYASGLVPGAALDVGSGEGADALWLAERGWRVTAVDISQVALDRAAAVAHRHGLDLAQRVTWQREDILSWDPGVAEFDLVSAQFMHLPQVDLQAVHRRLATAVRPGGTLLIVGHDVSDLDTGARRPHRPDLMFSADDVAGLLEPQEWQIVVNDTLAREATFEGETFTVRDAVVVATRR